LPYQSTRKVDKGHISMRIQAEADSDEEEYNAGGEKFQALRARGNEIGMSDKELYEATGIPRSTFGRYLNGSYGLAALFEQHLRALTRVVAAEERRLRKVLALK
jgi:hypothetical protein